MVFIQSMNLKNQSYDTIDCFGNSDGGQYLGEICDGKANGQGTYISKTISNTPRDKYEGEFRNGKANGQGTYTYKDNQAVYSGEFRNGEFEGQGTYESYMLDDEYICTGEFKHSAMNGQVDVYFKKGDKYNGKIYGDEYSKGTYTFENGDKYIGEFSFYCQPHGKGTYIFSSGKKLVGEFRFSELVKPSVEDVFFPFSKTLDPHKMIKKYGTGFKFITKTVGLIRNEKIDIDLLLNSNNNI